MIQSSYCHECRDAFELIAECVAGDVVRCPRCGTKVQVFNAETWIPVDTSPNDETVPSDVEIAGYEIRQPLGRGGMGVVLEGRQVSLGRRVAIKLLMPSLAGKQDFVERFEREAAALARLSHPNIVTIFERGQTSQGMYFIMEYVEGPGGSAPLDLRAMLNQRRLTSAEVKQFSLQVVRALAYAHQQGIVHRDMKPGNVMIDRHGNAKVADFGIASISNEQEGMQLTAPSSALGTFDYMAPEQRDNATQVDQRADVYSVGVMLYEMLTGELPRGAYQPPSRVSSGLDVGWDKVVELTLQPRPEKRLGNMEELAIRIDSIPTTAVSSGLVGPATQSQVSANEPPNHASVALFCLDCGASVSHETRFCPGCRATQWTDCPGCQRTIHASVRFCPSCGGDIQGFRMLLQYMETAHGALILARDKKLPLSERCHQALQAGFAASRATKYSPQNETYRELLAEANRCYLSLACPASDEAYKDRRLDEARGFLEQILHIQPDHAESIARLNMIQKYFREGRSKADQLMTEGFPGKAANVLEKLIRSFPDDEELTAQLEECRRNHQQVEEVVQRIIPALVLENKWWAIRREIVQLQRASVQVNGLSDYAVAVDSRLAEIAPNIRKAEKSLARGSVQEATMYAEQILKRVADHPRAAEIVAIAKQMGQEAQELSRRLKAASSNGEWFDASAMLAVAGPAVHGINLRDLENSLRKGCREANNYARLVLWTFLGAGLVMVGTKLRDLMMTGIEDLLPRIASGPMLWQTHTLRTACSLGFSIVIGVGIFVLLRAILRRPVYPMRVGVWAAIRLAGAAFFLFTHMASSGIGTLAWIIELAGLCGLGFATGLVVALASRDVVEPPIIRLIPTALAGGAALIVLQFTTTYQDNYTRFLTPALWLSCLLIVTRNASHWRQTIPVVFAGLVAGVLAVGGQRQYGSFSDMTLGLTATFVLSTTWIVVSSGRRLRQSAVVVVILFGVFTVYTMLPTFREALTLWFILVATVAENGGDYLDPRLHIIDRIRARRTRMSIPTTSSVHH